MRRRYLCGALVGVLATAGGLTTASTARSASSHAQAKPSVMRVFKGKSSRPRTNSNNLYYHGGVGGIGVETAPRVYLVLWGSQWSNDPYGEAGILGNFLGNVFGSSWLNSVTQYCQGVSSGTFTCGSLGQPAGNANGVFAGTIQDNGSAAPSSPSQSQLASEAIKIAGQVGNSATTQFVIATAHGNNASGFGSSYCAWHSSTSSQYGNIAYTNLPYMPDAGASCGSNFVNAGPSGVTDGVTIVEGHELAETITDQFPNGGWLDRNGSENGDKCAWSAATSNQSLNGVLFPVQPLWSNASSSCKLSY